LISWYGKLISITVSLAPDFESTWACDLFYLINCSRNGRVPAVHWRFCMLPLPQFHYPQLSNIKATSSRTRVHRKHRAEAKHGRGPRQDQQSHQASPQLHTAIWLSHVTSWHMAMREVVHPCIRVPPCHGPTFCSFGYSWSTAVWKY
jgi:hypothetical protein